MRSMKHKVIAMKLVGEKMFTRPVNLPTGCKGILFVFDSKKAARAYWGKDIELVRVDYGEAKK